MIKTCQCCGREFTTANGKQIYCSRKCTDKIYYLRKIGRLEKFVKIIEKPPKQRECTNCGKIFAESFHNERFCSDDCRLQYWEKFNTKISLWSGNAEIKVTEDLRS